MRRVYGGRRGRMSTIMMTFHQTLHEPPTMRKFSHVLDYVTRLFLSCKAVCRFSVKKIKFCCFDDVNLATSRFKLPMR